MNRGLTLLLVAFALCSATSRAQVAWERVPLLAGRGGLAMVHDPLRGHTMAFGGEDAELRNELDETLIWDGTTWTRLEPLHRPSPRTAHAMAFDPMRGLTVLFGGHDGGTLGDTWIWNGADWFAVSPASSPSPRHGHAMTWDGTRNAVLLQGGRDAGNQFLDDTWQWDGITWTRLAPTTAPHPRARHAMAYDANRNVVVMWGGACYLPYFWCNLDDTWEWDGSDWTQRTPVHRPPSRWAHSLTYDTRRGRIVMFGGGEEPWHVSGDTWEWDGVDWTPVALLGGPRARDGHAAAWDGTRVLVFAGNEFMGMNLAHADTWAWDGTTWTEVAPPPSPPWRDHAAMAWEAASGRTLLFHGNPYYGGGNTWLFDGAAWSKLAPPGEPSFRHDYALAPAPTSNGVVLFGGLSGSTFLDETWLWDGTVWTALAPSRRPAARRGPAMVTDTTRARLVMFGGSTFTTEFDDTWVFDRSDWAMVTTTVQPSARMRPAMAYDACRDRAVLFGGSARTGFLDDTWEFDGTTWAALSPPNRPPAGAHTATFDAARQRVVLNAVAAGTWEWDGADWTLRVPAASSPGGTAAFTSWDPLRARTVLYTPGYGTWIYGAVPASSARPFGQGCPGSRGTPTLTSTNGYGPFVGGSIRLDATSMPAAQTAFLELGLSRTTWVGWPLPIDLGPIGMPGCALHVSGDDVASFAVRGGIGSWQASVPGDPVLLGARLFVQALAIDPGANPLGAITSNAIELQVGGR